MATTYREIAIEDMLRTVEEAMSQAIDWWGDLPAPMKEAVEQFRAQLETAIDSVDLSEGHSTDKSMKLTVANALPDTCGSKRIRVWQPCDGAIATVARRQQYC
jgi:hypothetical protein